MAEEGFISKIETMTFEEVMDKRIENLQTKYTQGIIKSKTPIQQAIRTKKRLFGKNGVLTLAFGKDASEVLFSEVNSPEGQEKIYAKALETQDWYKGKPGAATDFWKSIQGAIGDRVGKSGQNWASAFGKDNPLILQGQKRGRAPVYTAQVYRDTVTQINKIKDNNARRLAKIMLLTGIRESDLIRLNVKDINFENGTITTSSEKGAGKRVIPVARSTLTLLQQQINESGKEQIFSLSGSLSKDVNAYGKKINPYLNKVIIEDLIKETSRGASLEDLRRAFSSRLEAIGVADSMQDRLMGHTAKGTKRIYQRGTSTVVSFADEGTKDIVNRLEKDLFTQLGYTNVNDVNAFTEGKMKMTVPAQTSAVAKQVEEVIPEQRVTVTQPEAKVKITEPVPVEKPIIKTLPPANRSNVSKILSKIGKKLYQFGIPIAVGGGAGVATKTAEAALWTATATPVGLSIDEQIANLMRTENISEGEAIELYKSNPPLEAPEGVYGIEGYEEKFKEKQQSKQVEEQLQKDIKEIWTKGLMNT